MFSFNPLFQKLHSDDNLARAWRSVRRHKHSSGVDGMSVSFFDSRSFVLLKKLQRELSKFSYRPKPVKRIFMKREVGPPRPIGILIITDRIVHRALAQILIPVFEPLFDDYSHAYRTGRSVQTAIAQARDHALGGRPWLIKIDLHDCFGQIPHKPVLRCVNRYIKDFAVRRLLKRLLQVEVYIESNSGLRQLIKPEGLLQGSALSPLLANIYLDEFDKTARDQGLRFVRYGDDVALFAASQQEAEATLDAATRILERMHLPINREKTRLYHLSKGCQYLGEWLALQKKKNGKWAIKHASK